jgi:radical SAM superfamily enzyme YgiQ (UPF0313 family)
MDQPLKIYLGDLTYDTIALSTEVFPLNVGYVGAYCVERFGTGVDVRIFKYIADLDRALSEEPPDVLGLSNYCWNHRVGLEMFRMLARHNPHALTVWGGPNFPLDVASRQELMDRYPELDAYVPVEGEIGFGNLVQHVLEARSLEAAKAFVRTASIEGCVTRGEDGTLRYRPIIRRGDLDTIPSPYLSGLLDKFFDGRLVPMIQTNRGCPFTCSFCVDGSTLVSKVNYFTIERVRRELEYIGARVPSTTHGMEISDLNFGMYKRDAEICDVIRDIQERYGWPKYITTSTGKNRKERIIEAVGRLKGSLRLTMSVQSTNAQVLTNIKRDNISLDAMMALAPKIKEAGLRTYSEVILSLPGETYATHIQSVRDLTSANIDFIKGYTLMLLAGSELATPAEREKWGFVTKFRPLTMDFAELSNGRRVIETEEIVVGSNTLSYDEYVDLRVLAFTLWVMTRGLAYDALLKFLKQHHVDVVALFLGVKSAVAAPESVRRVLEAFRQATVKELWESPDAIEQHYQDDAAYGKLLNGEEGINLLNYFGGVVTAEHMEDWTDYTVEVARRLLLDAGLTDDALRQFEDIANYCRGITYNVLRQDRRDRDPEFDLVFDIEHWLKDETGKTLDEFELSHSQPVSFQLSQAQITLLDDLLAMHGNTVAGRGQALKYVPVHMLWRQPVVMQRA